MKLSTRSKYGLRAMLMLAIHEGHEPVMTKEIAERENLPATYLEQLMLTLRKAGLVNATRGAKGGYVLARSPGDMTIAEIIEALEGPLDIADFADAADAPTDASSLVLGELFGRANAALRGVFEEMSLAQLAREQKSREMSRVAMYHI